MVRVAFIGAGGIAAEHLNNLHNNEQAEIVAICDIVRENAEKAAEKYGAVPYSNKELMLSSEKIDALFVCVPPFAHEDIEEKAAQRGIHLLVEKPLGLDLEIVRKKAEVIETSGILAGTGYCLRYLDTIALAKQYLQDKKIAMVRAHRFGPFVEVPWFRQMSKSGGQLVEQTTHNLDLMLYLAGKVNRVSADMALTVMNEISNIDIPDVSSVNLRFESGAVGHIDTAFIDQPDYRSGLEVMGRNFRVNFDGYTLSIIENGKVTTIKNQNNVYKTQDDAFIQAVLTGDRSLILAPYEEALKTLEVTLAANQSAASGATVIIG